MAQTLREMCAQQEELLEFERFSREDALALGLKLHENSKKYSQRVAIAITLNGNTVFQYLPEGTGRHNLDWLERKKRTVTQFEKSSLHVMAMLEEAGLTAQDEKLDEMNFALGGGGFPLRVRGVGVVGVIAVSALPHLDDHQLVVDTIKEFLGK